MDKQEFQTKTEEMLRCMEQKDYRKARDIAAAIDWKRVKNVLMLCKASEIFEYNRDYARSREILFYAYDRRPNSRKIVYRLGTLALKLGDANEAQDCYEEYVNLAPKDPNQYVLLYKIQKAKGAPIEDQIRTLSDFKKVEHIEKWAYELATLYDQAGMTEECLAECDDLILWFSEGKYVFKAMELKKRYKPLTPLQQEKYERFLAEEEEKEEEPVVEAAAEAAATQEDLPAEYREDNRPLIKETKEEAEEQAEPEDEKDELEGIDIEADKMQILAAQVDRKDDEVPAEKDEPVERTEATVEDEPPVDEKAAEEVAEAVADEPEETLAPEPEEAGSDEETVDAVPEADSLDAILSSWENEQEKEAGEAAPEESADEEFFEDEAEEDKKVAAKELSLDSFLAKFRRKPKNSEEDEDDEYEEIDETEKVDEPEEELIETPEADEAEMADEEFFIEKMAQTKKFSLHEEIEIEDDEEESIEQATEDISGILLDEDLFEEELPHIAEYTEEEPSDKEEVPDEEEYAEEEILDGEEEFAEEEILDGEEEFAEDEFVEDDIFDDEEDFAEAELANEDEFAEDELGNEDEFVEDDIANEDEFAEDEFDDEEYFVEEEPAQEEFAPGVLDDEGWAEEVDDEELLEDDEDDHDRSGGGVSFDTGFVVEGRYDLEAQSEIGLKAGMTQEQKELFSYFVPVQGMSEQIVAVLENDINCTDRYGTSRTGNLLIIGHKGSGKTVLAVDIIKALQKNRRLDKGRVAIVDAEKLNNKDLPSVIERLSGGSLIIEHASDLSAETVVQLNELMEGQTREMFVVLEEQKEPLGIFLHQYPEFAAKFTSKLEVPIFINDDLVAFGQTYAKENGYRIDEMGILALYSRIDALQRDDHAVTVAEVKDIMDEAIARSKKNNVKKLFKRNKDGHNRIILQEVDFRK